MSEQEKEVFKQAINALESAGGTKDEFIILQMLEHAYLLGKSASRE